MVFDVKRLGHVTNREVRKNLSRMAEWILAGTRADAGALRVDSKMFRPLRLCFPDSSIRPKADAYRTGTRLVALAGRAAQFFEGRPAR